MPAPSRPEPALTSATKKRVLVVEDDAEIRGFVTRTLRATYEVSAAGDAAEALALLATGGVPDLVLCDVALPGMDGFALVQAIRGQAHLARVPVVFLTARAGVLDIVRGINLGARNYVQKPFKMHDLVTLVGKALDR